MASMEDSIDVQIKYVSNENLFLKISAFTINSTSYQRQKKIRKLYEAQQESFEKNLMATPPRTNCLHVAKVDSNVYERCKVSSFDSIKQIAYVKFIDASFHAAFVPFQQVLLFHKCSCVVF